MITEEVLLIKHYVRWQHDKAISSLSHCKTSENSQLKSVIDGVWLTHKNYQPDLRSTLNIVGWPMCWHSVLNERYKWEVTPRMRPVNLWVISNVKSFVLCWFWVISILAGYVPRQLRPGWKTECVLVFLAYCIGTYTLIISVILVALMNYYIIY